MRRVLLFCAAITFAIACGDTVTEPVPDRTLATPPIAFATTTTEDGLSISTDKDDYAPGNVVVFTGSGWESGHVLDIVLTDDPLTHEPHTWSVTVGADGTFEDRTYVVDDGDLNVTFTLVATDPLTGQSLTVVFTDGNLQLQPDPTADPFSPNADAAKDATTISYRNQGNGTEANVAISIRQGTLSGGTLVRQFTLGDLSKDASGSVVWNGNNSATPATVVAEGEYGIRIFNASQTEPTAGGQRLYIVLVDNTAPGISSPAVSPPSVEEGVSADVNVTATATDNPLSGVSVNRYKPVSGEYNIDGGAFTSMTVSAGSGPNVKSLSATIPGSIVKDLADGSHLICIRATDDADNRSANNASGNSNCATLEVASANAAPVLDAVGNKTVAEEAQLAFTAKAQDEDVGSLVFSLANPATGTYPTGALITAGGAFTWTPTEAQGPGTYRVKVIVTDEETLTDEEEIEITVSEVNKAPEVTAIPDKTIDEETPLTFTATAVDADLPANSLTFSLVGAPTGANITGAGAFSWTPTETQGPATYTFKVRATDNGTPALFSEAEVKVIVNEVNQPPVLAAIGNKSVNEGSLVSFTAVANDADVPPNTLTYSLDGAPAGASINASTGAFSWTPLDDDPTGTSTDGNMFKVIVRDNGTPQLSDEETITVTVNNLAPSIGTLTKSDGSPLPASVLVEGTLSIKVPFSDLGTNDTHTGYIDCGTGTYVALGVVTTPSFNAPCTFEAVGSKVVKVKVNDDDLGSTETSFTILVKYGFEGLYAPVDRPNTYNLSKAGQSIPLKWRLTDATGAPITDLTTVSLKVGSLACGTNPFEDLVEEYAPGASGLQNLGNGYYQYNWKTPTSYANLCKSIGLDFGYVEGPLANFHFKK